MSDRRHWLLASLFPPFLIAGLLMLIVLAPGVGAAKEEPGSDARRPQVGNGYFNPLEEDCAYLVGNSTESDDNGQFDVLPGYISFEQELPVSFRGRFSVTKRIGKNDRACVNELMQFQSKEGGLFTGAEENSLAYHSVFGEMDFAWSDRLTDNVRINPRNGLWMGRAELTELEDYKSSLGISGPILDDKLQFDWDCAGEDWCFDPDHQNVQSNPDLACDAPLRYEEADGSRVTKCINPKEWRVKTDLSTGEITGVAWNFHTGYVVFGGEQFESSSNPFSIPNSGLSMETIPLEIQVVPYILSDITDLSTTPDNITTVNSPIADGYDHWVIGVELYDLQNGRYLNEGSDVEPWSVDLDVERPLDPNTGSPVTAELMQTAYYGPQLERGQFGVGEEFDFDPGDSALVQKRNRFYSQYNPVLAQEGIDAECYTTLTPDVTIPEACRLPKYSIQEQGRQHDSWNLFFASAAPTSDANGPLNALGSLEYPVDRPGGLDVYPYYGINYQARCFFGFGVSLNGDDGCPAKVNYFNNRTQTKNLHAVSAIQLNSLTFTEDFLNGRDYVIDWGAFNQNNEKTFHRNSSKTLSGTVDFSEVQILPFRPRVMSDKLLSYYAAGKLGVVDDRDYFSVDGASGSIFFDKDWSTEFRLRVDSRVLPRQHLYDEMGQTPPALLDAAAIYVIADDESGFDSLEFDARNQGAALSIQSPYLVLGNRVHSNENYVLTSDEELAVGAWIDFRWPNQANALYGDPDIKYGAGTPFQAGLAYPNQPFSKTYYVYYSAPYYNTGSQAPTPFPHAGWDPLYKDIHSQTFEVFACEILSEETFVWANRQPDYLSYLSDGLTESCYFVDYYPNGTSFYAPTEGAELRGAIVSDTADPDAFLTNDENLTRFGSSTFKSVRNQLFSRITQIVGGRRAPGGQLTNGLVPSNERDFVSTMDGQVLSANGDVYIQETTKAFEPKTIAVFDGDVYIEGDISGGDLQIVVFDGSIYIDPRVKNLRGVHLFAENIFSDHNGVGAYYDPATGEFQEGKVDGVNVPLWYGYVAAQDIWISGNPAFQFLSDFFGLFLNNQSGLVNNLSLRDEYLSNQLYIQGTITSCNYFGERYQSKVFDEEGDLGIGANRLLEPFASLQAVDEQLEESPIGCGRFVYDPYLVNTNDQSGEVETRSVALGGRGGRDFIMGELVAQEYNLNALRSVPLCYLEDSRTGGPTEHVILCDEAKVSDYRVPEDERVSFCLEYETDGLTGEVYCVRESDPYPYSTASVIIEHKAPSRDHAIRFTDL